MILTYIFILSHAYYDKLQHHFTCTQFFSSLEFIGGPGHTDLSAIAPKSIGFKAIVSKKIGGKESRTLPNFSSLKFQSKILPDSNKIIKIDIKLYKINLSLSLSASIS